MWTSFLHSRSSSKRKALRGFTIVELLVVVVIISFMTTVLLLQQQKFDSSTLLRSLAYSVALTVRQAQIYGTSVREFNSSFSYNYGVYFSTGSPNDYYLFADINNNQVYNATPIDEKVQQFKIGNHYSIVRLCPTSACTTELTSLAIYFRRPNPDAFFAGSPAGSYTSAYIQLRGPGGTTRSVTVTSTGQILVGAVGT